MSAVASISGLASGLDTATIIDQLMQLEAIPQARLRERVSDEKRAATAMQTLNSKLASLAGKAAELADAKTWTAISATSSDSQVSVTAGSGAAPGTFSLRVDATALAHRLEFASPTGLETAGTVPTTVRLDRLDGTTLDLTTDGTLRGLVAAINDPELETGLRATAVKVGEDALGKAQYQLLVTATETGAASDFTLTDAADGSALLGGATTRAGRDAQVTVGDSITVTSTSNTFTDLVPGVTVTLGAGAGPDEAGEKTTADLTLGRDSSKLATAMQSLVDGVNAALADIDSLTDYDPVTKASGLLAGDAGIRALRGKLLDTVFPTNGTSLADLGIQTDRSGQLVFDREKFTAAHEADPTAVQTRLQAERTGFVARLQTVAEGASDKATGSLTLSITGRNTAIERLNDSIDNWDIRLELRRTALTRQFTALETALSRMNSQANWLAGQISSLPTGSGS